jgi:chloramphenicol 3-O-phosphotransferase
MDSTAVPLALVIVAGPQASGKSTLASTFSAEIRRGDERVALVELDQIAAMALPTLPSWEAAHHIFETTVGLWARTDLTCVVAEGSGSADEVARLREHAPEAAVVVVVAVTTSFDTAFSRAQSDPTRGISKEHGFLSDAYRGWMDELARIEPDLIIDTDQVTVEESIRRVRSAIESARHREG